MILSAVRGNPLVRACRPTTLIAPFVVTALCFMLAAYHVPDSSQVRSVTWLSLCVNSHAMPTNPRKIIEMLDLLQKGRSSGIDTQANTKKTVVVSGHALYSSKTCFCLQILSEMEARAERVPPSAFAVYEQGATRLTSVGRRTEAKQEQQRRTKLLATSLALSDEIQINMPKSEGGRWHQKWTNEGWVKAFPAARHARLQGLVSINAANEPGPENEHIQAEAQISSHALLHESGSKASFQDMEHAHSFCKILLLCPNILRVYVSRMMHA
jgi:hypothetical protein